MAKKQPTIEIMPRFKDGEAFFYGTFARKRAERGATANEARQLFEACIRSGSVVYALDVGLYPKLKAYLCKQL